MAIRVYLCAYWTDPVSRLTFGAGLATVVVTVTVVPSSRASVTVSVVVVPSDIIYRVYESCDHTLSLLNVVTATIVNAHAEYVIGNMRSAFAARGKRGVEMAWWHANNFPQHRFADVFDDVIEDVLARGVIGDEADGCRVRGAVGV